ncbi:MAG: peptidylprolyl isomerase [bacterium]|nr:peptidylprolyl isomerase [bacterium]
MEVADGRVVVLEYTVHFANGRLLDSTGHCGPIAVMQGSGQLFPALEDRIVGMQAGETRELHIPAEEAYGPWREDLVREMPRDRLPPDLDLTVGDEYSLKSPDGKTLRFRLLEIGGASVRADFNPPGAGQGLKATVTVIAVRPPTPDEERRGRT